MNTQGTDEGSVTVGLPDPATMRANLIAQRNEYGAESAIGHHCSNLIELLQVPELPRDLIRRQLDGLARLTAAGA